MSADQIRDAATLILVRQGAMGPSVLVGQRGATAAFMPMKFVFPGGAVDAEDAAVPLAEPLPPEAAAPLLAMNARVSPEALVAAAIRELWEETGLILGRPGAWVGKPPPAWQSFAETRHLPTPSGMRFVFRAITPPGRSRRFDARFLLADAAALACDADDFSRASDELADLHWVLLAEARRLDLPFITSVVLAEVEARLRGVAGVGVPFFKNDGGVSEFLRL